MSAIELIIGIATWYGEPYIGGDLFCGGVYTDTTAPWVALPYRDYGTAWECGDLVALWFEDAQETLIARAMDTGPFGANCVIDGDACVPIVADVPEHLWPVDGLSARVRVTNVTAACRAGGLCD